MNPAEADPLLPEAAAADAGAEQPAEPSKPKRRRTPRPVVEAEAAAPPVASDFEAPTAEQLFAKPAAAVESSAASASVEPVATVAPGPTELSAPIEAGTE